MNKTFIKSLINSFLALSLSLFFLASCSSDTPDPQVVINSVTPNKTVAYIEDTITLTIDGTGQNETAVTSANTKVKIAKAASNVYEITATEATLAIIYIELKNNSNKSTKSISLTFAEHGVKDFTTVEGIKVNVDLSAKVISFLGEPDSKITSTDGLSEYWNYFSKGLTFFIIKSSSIITQIDMKSNYYSGYTTYQYEIANGWKLNATTMDMVTTQLGLPTIKNTSATSTTYRTYQYSTQKIVFGFFSETEDNYTGKKIIYFSVY